MTRIEPRSIRLSENNEQSIKEYQAERHVTNATIAINQLIRMGVIWHNHMVTGGNKPYGKWYTPPQDSKLRCMIDELSDEERNIMLFELSKKCFGGPRGFKIYKDSATQSRHLLDGDNNNDNDDEGSLGDIFSIGDHHDT